MAGLEELCLITALICGIFFFMAMGLLFALVTGWILWTIGKWTKKEKILQRATAFLWRQLIKEGEAKDGRRTTDPGV